MSLTRQMRRAMPPEHEALVTAMIDVVRALTSLPYDRSLLRNLIHQALWDVTQYKGKSCNQVRRTAMANRASSRQSSAAVEGSAARACRRAGLAYSTSLGELGRGRCRLVEYACCTRHEGGGEAASERPPMGRPLGMGSLPRSWTLADRRGKPPPRRPPSNERGASRCLCADRRTSGCRRR